MRTAHGQTPQPHATSERPDRKTCQRDSRRTRPTRGSTTDKELRWGRRAGTPRGREESVRETRAAWRGAAATRASATTGAHQTTHVHVYHRTRKPQQALQMPTGLVQPSHLLSVKPLQIK